MQTKELMSLRASLCWIALLLFTAVSITTFAATIGIRLAQAVLP
jgi:hypothetical protein